MKHSLLKSLESLLLVVVFCFSTCCLAFATESDSTIAFDVDASTKSDVEIKSTRNGGYDIGEIPAKGTLTLHPILNDYEGDKISLFVLTDNIYSDTVPSGTISVTVFNPYGLQINFVQMSASDFWSYKFTWPMTGKYTLKIKSTVNQKIYISAGWSNKL